MYNDRETLMEVLDLIVELNLQESVILIGSWDEYFYERLYEGYYSSFRTLDTDFLIRRPVNAGKTFIRRMQELGFLYEEDPFSGKSKLIKLDNEIEFLTTLTRENRHIYKVPVMGINAECLKYMDIPARNLIPFTFENGTYILIPSPAAYCIQKVLIHDERTEEKQEKDAMAVRNILNSLGNREEFKESFCRIYSELGKKQRSKFVKNAESIAVTKTVVDILNSQKSEMIK